MSKNSYFKHSFIIQKHDILMIAMHLSVFRHYENMTIFFFLKGEEDQLLLFCVWNDQNSLANRMKCYNQYWKSKIYGGFFGLDYDVLNFAFFTELVLLSEIAAYYKIFIFKIKNSYMITLIKNAIVRCLCSHCENSM